jgi:hypothetical protein
LLGRWREMTTLVTAGRSPPLNLMKIRDGILFI